MTRKGGPSFKVKGILIRGLIISINTLYMDNIRVLERNSINIKHVGETHCVRSSNDGRLI